MWLNVYLRLAGVDPIPFRHRTQTLHVADLQRQLSAVQRNFTEQDWLQFRRAARKLVRAGSLEAIATGHERVNSSEIPLQREATASRSLVTAATTNRTGPTATERWNCNRKLKHTNYLSALQHAIQLDDSNLRIYPCSVCFGLHVGHDSVATRLKITERELTDIDARLAELKTECEQLNRRQVALFDRRERLRTLKVGLAIDIDHES
jgi:hypothetical protein